ncbi:MAG: DUF1501 domain-containing protein [Planctomycetota bacterium]|nr:DUF1501 domain-containing protein [Planctomycetota bacterium]
MTLQSNSAGQRSHYCDGLNRRSFVKLGMAGMASMGLSTLLQAKAQSAATQQGAKKDTSVILIWLDGGPSHIDLYDMKPDAPAEVRGIWKPMPTNVPGINICEMLPEQAKVADKFSIIRSLSHNLVDHFIGSHMVLTGRPGGSEIIANASSPSIGAVAAKLVGARRAAMPPFVAIPEALTVWHRPGYFGASYTGSACNPFNAGSDPSLSNFSVPNLVLGEGMSVGRLQNRGALLSSLDHTRRTVDQRGVMDSMDQFQAKAYEMVTGTAARDAFDINKETPEMRERYGQNVLGQSCLLARRMVEAGSTFVTVCDIAWDHHINIEQDYKVKIPRLDRAVASLFSDLSERGLLSKTLVVVMGEFSRTPKMNNGVLGALVGAPGRDHWGNAMCCLLGGGGVQGGRIIGSTSSTADMPKDSPCTVGDLHATIYRVLGIDPATTLMDQSGRPVPLIDEGKAIEALF